MILDARRDTQLDRSDEFPKTTIRRRGPFWQGVTTEVLNPKTALFFLSFIPQFVNRESGHVFLQFLFLGSVSVGLNTSADLIVTALAGPLGELHSLLGNLRAASAYGDGSDHDRVGNVPGNQ